jgi:acetyl-CoA C-acetyltransferase
MKRAAIVAPVRTAVGLFGGLLRDVPVEALARTVIRETVRRSGIDPERIDDVVFAQSYANSETPCIGRWAALDAGLPIAVPGSQVDRRCGGGLQAILNAAMMVQSGACDAVVAGGVESMSNIEFYTTDMRWGRRSGSTLLHDRLERGRERSQPAARFGRIGGMVETAETLAREYGITREEADAFSVRSHQRAAQARDSGRFAEEIVPIEIPQKKGGPILFAQDEGIRADASVESLARLKPMIKDGVVTAGNASQQNDAAAACLVVAEDQLEALGLTPIAYVTGWAAAGCDPARMGIGPVPAVQRLFQRTGLSFKDMDLVELNEAFAVQAPAVLKGWDWNHPERLNVNGSGISIGHPIGATGVRIAVTLLNEMKRRGARYGLECMCIGGGQGLAAVFESA